MKSSGQWFVHAGTSSMIAAICYAWLLENRKEKEEGWEVVAPVINMKRGRMWKQKQAAWFFHHTGIDADALLFSDEVDLEGLLMGRQLNVLVVGQDVLQTNNEVGSQCTVLTDNYCEDAYDLLQTPYLKKLLLAGILLDTDNLSASAKLSTNRDAEAVQLLLVGSAPNLRHTLFEKLIEDRRDSSFLEGLRNNYGKPTNASNSSYEERGAAVERRISTRKSVSTYNQDINNMRTSYSIRGDIKDAKTAQTKSLSIPAPVEALVPAPTQQVPAPRGKNKSFLAKLFGFGSK